MAGEDGRRRARPMSTFRFHPERGTERVIGVELLLEDDRVFPGEPISVDGSGAAASFPLDRSPALCLAHAVRLRFTCANERGSVVLAARTRQRREHDGRREYHFLFVDRQAVEKQLLPWLRPLLDRRGVVRVRPPAARSVEVRLDAPGLRRPVLGSLFDLSESGLAVQIACDCEEALAEVDRVRARFVLPGHPPAEVEVASRIVLRRLAGTRVQLGLAFLPEPSAHFQRHEQAIRRFVVECQTRALGRAG